MCSPLSSFERTLECILEQKWTKVRGRLEHTQASPLTVKSSLAFNCKVKSLGSPPLPPDQKLQCTVILKLLMWPCKSEWQRRSTSDSQAWNPAENTITTEWRKKKKKTRTTLPLGIVMRREKTEDEEQKMAGEFFFNKPTYMKTTSRHKSQP